MVNASNPYSPGERFRMPCGCVGEKTASGYLHYVHPDCRFDQGRQGSNKIWGYQYVGWSDELGAPD